MFFFRQINFGLVLFFLLSSFKSYSQEINMGWDSCNCITTSSSYPRVDCYGTNLDVKTSTGTWHAATSGDIISSYILWDNSILVKIVIYGALTVLQYNLYDLYSGKSYFSIDAAPFYFDAKRVLFLPTDVGAGQVTENPTVYIYRKEDIKYLSRTYHLLPRKGCGMGYDMQQAKNSVSILRDSVIFHRIDQCGDFNIVLSLPK